MPTSTYQVGPGVLTFGTGPLAVAAQIEACEVLTTETVTTGTERYTLDGGTRLGADKPATYRQTIGGTAIQDLDAGGFVRYTWAHAGEETPFVFVPNEEANLAISGICYPYNLRIGGDVREDGPTATFSWRIKGAAILGAYDPVTEEVTEDV